MPTAPTTFRPYKWPATVRTDNRPPSSHRGYNEKWRRLSIAYKKANPFCETCLTIGVQVPTHEVDHKIPFEGIDDPLRLDWHNLKSLCRSHHATKTHADKKRAAQ